MIRHPAKRRAGCCAHAAVLPNPAMNSRRRIRDLPHWIGEAIAEPVARERGRASASVPGSYTA